MNNENANRDKFGNILGIYSITSGARRIINSFCRCKMLILVASLLTFAQCSECTLEEFGRKVRTAIAKNVCGQHSDCKGYQSNLYGYEPYFSWCCERRFFERVDMEQKHQKIKDLHADIIKMLRQIKPSVCPDAKLRLEVTVKIKMIDVKENLAVWVAENYEIDDMHIADVQNYICDTTTPYKIRETERITNYEPYDHDKVELVIDPLVPDDPCYELSLILRETQTK